MLDPRFSYTIREPKDKVLPARSRWLIALSFIAGVLLALAVLHMFLEGL